MSDDVAERAMPSDDDDLDAVIEEADDTPYTVRLARDLTTLFEEGLTEAGELTYCVSLFNARDEIAQRTNLLDAIERISPAAQWDEKYSLVRVQIRNEITRLEAFVEWWAVNGGD